MEADLSGAVWRKASLSSDNGGECVEMATVGPLFALRDSKDPDGPKLILTRTAWRAFLGEVRQGSFDI
ncbi:DUF397 domain-containing protein [Streptosporangium sp. NPDC001559]|uniref:DUF397 domain-containing protein n=1 Tax=Streptosporangium sp. NPDC001559 TaxID=3366187 RepID=UPI0036EADF0F